MAAGTSTIYLTTTLADEVSWRSVVNIATALVKERIADEAEAGDPPMRILSLSVRELLGG